MYLDPGFGSMIVQLVVALIAGAGAIWLMAKNKVKKLFQKKDKSSADETVNSEVKSDDKEYTIEE